MVYSLSVVIILVYYVMINNGEQLAATGRLQPWLAMWGPNILMLSLGLYLLGRANREAGVGRAKGGVVRTLVAGVVALFSRKPQAPSVEMAAVAEIDGDNPA